MKSEDYEKISSVLPLGEVMEKIIAELRNSIQDANNQAENGSELGMAVAVGKSYKLVDELLNVWLAIKK